MWKVSFFKTFKNYLCCKFHINNFSIVSINGKQRFNEFERFLYSNLPSQNFLLVQRFCYDVCCENIKKLIVTKLSTSLNFAYHLCSHIRLWVICDWLYLTCGFKEINLNVCEHLWCEFDWFVKLVRRGTKKKKKIKVFKVFGTK